eukprot:scaffold102637_cov47-Phaeocystis_antarctica.AAC.5
MCTGRCGRPRLGPATPTPNSNPNPKLHPNPNPNLDPNPNPDPDLYPDPNQVRFAGTAPPEYTVDVLATSRAPIGG